MLLQIRKLGLAFALCGGILLLNACASVMFPDIDDDDEIVVGEGGRVVKTLPGEGKTLNADTEHASYEGQEDKNDVVEKTDDVIPEEDKAEPAEVKPVVREVEEPVAVSEAKAVETLILPDEQKGPSVSYRADTFYFENGSSVLSSDYKDNISRIAKEVKANGANVIVYGYASSRTRNTDAATHKLANFKVSSERAQNVANALKKAGVPASKITVEALSDTAPAYQEVMPEGERLNRRAEVYISY